jgi:hypothetical protein
MNSRFVCFAAAFIVGSLLTFQPCPAQITSGQINGRVVDPNGQPIVNAEVTLVNQLNAGPRSVNTDGEGEFVFPSVQPGTYDLSVILQGFKSFSKRGIVVNASDELSAGTLQMEIGATTQSINVLADVTPVQTESGERSALIDQKQLETLSDPARNFLNFVRLLPGVVGTGTTGQDQLGIYGMDTINGQRSEYSTVSIDGVNANTNANRIDLVQTPLNTDAISEVKVLANNFQAETGGTSGAAINAVSKSGTKDFHGTVYYYKRHEEFNANDYFNSAYWNGTEQPKGINRFNTVGYNIGGPVLIPKTNFNRNRDKLFFFFSQEIWPTVHPGDGNPLRLRVPTAQERQGAFSTPVADPQKTAQGLTCVNNGDAGCFPNNTIPSSRIDSNMVKLLNLLPLPTPGYVDPSGITNYILNLTEHNPVNQQVLRVDYNISEKWRAYFRGLNMSVASKGNAAADTPMNYLTDFPVNYINSSPNVIVDLTYIANPTLVNEATIGYSAWSENQQFPNGQGELKAVQKSALGITLPQFRPELNPRDLIPALTFGGGGLSKLPNIGFSGSNGSRFPIDSQSTSYGVTDGITKVWQDHISKAGIYFHIDRFVQLHTAGDFAGLYNFSVSTQNPLDTGNTYANALLGNFLQYSESTSAPDSDPFTRILEWYVQDTWKVARGLTLDYGLRFSYDLPQTLHSGANFVPSTYDPAQTPVLYHPALAGGMKVGVDPRNGTQVNQVLIGAVVPGSGNAFDGMVTIKSSNPIQGQGLLVGPRLGFAWDVYGNGKTSFRGGAGIYYNSRSPSPQSGMLTTNPPNQENPIHPFGTVSQLFSSPDNSVIFPSNLNGAVQRNGQWPVFYNYSLGIQHSVGFSSVLDIAYVGNLGRHLGQTYDRNALAPGERFMAANQDPTSAGTPLSDNFLRPYTGLGSIPFIEFGGGSNYNSLQVSFTRRFTQGFSIGANYVWSKSLDYTDTTSTSCFTNCAAGTNSGLPTFAPRHAYSYGLAGYDRDHSAVINFLWNVPKASSLMDNLIVRTAFDNWQLSGIISYIRGVPLGIVLDTGGVDLTGGSDGPRALITGNAVLPHGQRKVLEYFNTSAVSLPPVNTPGSNGQYSNFVGNAGKVIFRGPGTDNYNVSLFKNFIIKERVTLQLRGEFYNLFNHPSFSSVDNTAVFTTSGQQTNGTFGEINGDNFGPRQVQLAGRISF